MLKLAKINLINCLKMESLQIYKTILTSSTINIQNPFYPEYIFIVKFILTFTVYDIHDK